MTTHDDDLPDEQLNALLDHLLSERLVDRRRALREALTICREVQTAQDQGAVNDADAVWLCVCRIEALLEGE